jgi:hypothetical protein
VRIAWVILVGNDDLAVAHAYVDHGPVVDVTRPMRVFRLASDEPARARGDLSDIVNSAAADHGPMPILACVTGEEFAALLTAAQDGSEAAFAALWRDCNPALLRHLRVTTPDAAEDIAGETWVQVVRGLPGFRGDERGWRSWLFTTARRRATDESRRCSRHPTAPLAELAGAQEPRTQDAAALAMENLGTAAAIAAISACHRCKRM